MKDWTRRVEQRAAARVDEAIERIGAAWRAVGAEVERDGHAVVASGRRLVKRWFEEAALRGLHRSAGRDR